MIQFWTRALRRDSGGCKQARKYDIAGTAGCVDFSCFSLVRISRRIEFRNARLAVGVGETRNVYTIHGFREIGALLCGDKLEPAAETPDPGKSQWGQNALYPRQYGTARHP